MNFVFFCFFFILNIFLRLARRVSGITRRVDLACKPGRCCEYLLSLDFVFGLIFV